MKIRSNDDVGRTIALRGNYSEANFGDDALLLASHQLLARHVGRIVIEGQVAYHDDRLTKLDNTFDDCCVYDAIVYGGGTQFFSFDHDAEAKVRPFWLRLMGKLTSPSKLLSSLRARRRSRVEAQIPKLSIGFGIGPFPDGGGSVEMAAAGIVKSMALVWVRDKDSAIFCQKHNIPAVLSSDLCFTKAFGDAVAAPPTLAGSQKRRVGIVLRDWRSLDDGFFMAVINATRNLRALDVDVVFFSFSPNDLQFRNVLKREGETVVGWERGAISLETYWKDLASMDLIVTARFHGAVFALLSEIPFLTFTIEPKLSLVQDWAPDGHKVTMEPIADSEMIGRQILAALEELPTRTATARDMLQIQRQHAEFGEASLNTFFEASDKA